MKKLLIIVLCMFMIGTVCEALSVTSLQYNTTLGPGKPKKKNNKATYGHSQGTYNLKSFYSHRRSPKSKNSKNMPSSSKYTK